MTPSEHRIFIRGVAAGTMVGLALGLTIALFIAIRPGFFAGLLH